MSGHKRTTVTISQEEYRRLYDAERKNYYQAFEMPDDVIYPLIQQSQNNLLSTYNQIAERQDHYEVVLNSFKSKIKDFENASSQSMVDQQIGFYNQLMVTSEQLWQDTSSVLQNQSNEFEANLQSQQVFLVESLNHLQAQINHISTRTSKLQETAENWLSDNIQLYTFIQTEYPAEVLDHNFLNNMHQQIQYGAINYENGFFEASLSIIQQVYAQLSTYRLSLENKITQLKTLHQSAYDQLAILKNQCEVNRSIQAIDISGDLLDQYIDVDYWNQNELSALLGEVDNLNFQISNGNNWCNEQLLLEVLENRIPSLSDKLGATLQEARRIALNAQLRYNTAQLVMVSLIQQGYRPDYGKFNQDDQRKGYLAEATGPDGSSVIIKVDPSTDVTNDLQIITTPSGTVTEAEMKRRSLEIMQSLQPYGLKVGQIEEIQASSKNSRRSRIVKTELNKMTVDRD